MILLIILSFIAVFTSYIGFGYFYELDTIKLYFVSFSKGFEGDYLRPSGLYDEPGAFTFFICCLIIARSTYSMYGIKTYLLLFGGLITQSIVQVIFIPIWLCWYMRNNLKNLRLSSFYLILMLLIGIMFYKLGYLDWSIERFYSFIDIPELNPRYRGLILVYNDIFSNTHNILWGADRNCALRNTLCQFDVMGENFLTPLIYGGLSSSWPYYLFIISIPIVFKDYFLLAIGLDLMLLQRPYLLEFSYSATVVFLVLCMGRNTFFRKHENLD